MCDYSDFIMSPFLTRYLIKIKFFTSIFYLNITFQLQMTQRRNPFIFFISLKTSNMKTEPIFSTERNLWVVDACFHSDPISPPSWSRLSIFTLRVYWVLFLRIFSGKVHHRYRTCREAGILEAAAAALCSLGSGFWVSIATTCRMFYGTIKNTGSSTWWRRSANVCTRTT